MYKLTDLESEALKKYKPVDDQLVFYGRIPSKKNSRINTKTGRSYPSKRYAEWERSMFLQLCKQNKKIFSAGLKGLDVTIYFPDLRVADLTNKAESIMDMLVKYNIIDDDNWQITGVITLKPVYRKNIGGFKIKKRSVKNDQS
jgi:Holliday junction resolvase RusA-like endonuclease